MKARPSMPGGWPGAAPLEGFQSERTDFLVIDIYMAMCSTHIVCPGLQLCIAVRLSLESRPVALPNCHPVLASNQTKNQMKNQMKNRIRFPQSVFLFIIIAI